MTGGKSERMGRQIHACIQISPSTKSYDLLRWSVTRHTSLADPTKTMLPLPTLKDNFLNIGPIGGLLTAFQKILTQLSQCRLRSPQQKLARLNT